MVQHHDTIHFHPKVVLLQKWMNPSHSSTLYSFSFRTAGNAQRSISFRMSPNDVGEVYVTVSYGDSGQNMVTQDSNVFTTISFN